MKTIEANSCGSIWRSDVFHAAKFDAVHVVDHRGNLLGLVTTHSKERSNSYYLNHRVISYDSLWKKMHEWSNVIARQQHEDYTKKHPTGAARWV